MGLDRDQIQQALAAATGFAGGISECFRAGTMEWRFQAGMAARNGIVSAQLARHGLQGAPSAFEGRSGFAQAFAGSTEHASAIAEDLGHHWELLEVTQKPYPVGGNSQPRIEAMLDIVRQHGVTYDQIDHIVDTMCADEGAYPGVDHKGPFETIGAGLMNPRFCVATAAVNGDVKIAHLQRVDDPRVLDLVQRIDLRLDKALPEFSSRLEVTLRDGRTLHAERVDAASSYKFSLERALGLARSLRDEMPIDDERIGAIADFVQSIERRGSVDELVGLCTVRQPSVSAGVRG
jgi:2-methylcitrate dehydratase PrpD